MAQITILINVIINGIEVQSDKIDNKSRCNYIVHQILMFHSVNIKSHQRILNFYHTTENHNSL